MKKIKKPDDATLHWISTMYVYHPETGEIDGPNNSDVGYWDTVMNRTYKRIEIKGRRYRRYHLAWFLYYGKWPESQIDHRDRDSTNDRIDNLRETDDFGQQQNRDIYNGYRGFSIEKKNDGKWRTKNWRVYNQTRKIYLGYCLDYEDGKKLIDEWYNKGGVI